MGNQFTSSCELQRLPEDDEIRNVNDDQVEEEELEREQNECDITLVNKLDCYTTLYFYFYTRSNEIHYLYFIDLLSSEHQL